MVLQVQTQNDVELEVWATTRPLGPFQKLVRKQVRLEVAPPPAGRRSGP